MNSAMQYLGIPGRLAFSVFLLSSLADLLGVFMGWHILTVCSKPLIVPSLALLCLLCMNNHSVPGKRIAALMLAMGFGASGDILLMFGGQSFFLAGLLAFLIGHFFYYLTIRSGYRRITSSQCLNISLLVVLIAVTASASRFFEVCGFLGVCVTVYACAFAFCIHAGIMAAIETKKCSYALTVAGYVLFVISDTILATGVFTDINIPERGFWVMLTYISAQFLLAVSLSFEEIRKSAEALGKSAFRPASSA